MNRLLGLGKTSFFTPSSSSLCSPSFSSQTRGLKTLRSCVVGSGPGGMYTAEFFLKKFGGEFDVQIDVVDKLPFPYGLVRYGVAPDHPEVKAVTNNFDALFAKENISFFGNIEVGKDVSVKELLDFYDTVVLSYGCEEEKRLIIPGCDLKGVHTAQEFIGWYNGHPHYSQSQNFDLSGKQAAVIGNGNVALDVARILVAPESLLAPTDITSYAAEALKESKINTVHILGRRGPAQTSWTNKEVRELVKLPNTTTFYKESDLQLSESVEKSIQRNRQKKKMLSLLSDHGTALSDEEFDQLTALPSPPLPTPLPTPLPSSLIAPYLPTIWGGGEKGEKGEKRVFLHFLKSPKVFVGGEDEKISALSASENELVDQDDGFVAKETTKIAHLPVDMVVGGIGYKALPLSLPPSFLPLDERRGVIPNEYGRVMRGEGEEGEGGLYASGWVKRGPSGIVGTNRFDAAETVDTIEEDLKNGMISPKNNQQSFSSLLTQKGIKYVDWKKWKKIDEVELKRGEERGKAREKVVVVKEALDLVGE